MRSYKKFVFILFLATTKSFFGSLAMHSRKLFHLFRVSKSTPFSKEYIVVLEITTLMLKFVQTPKIKLGSLFLILVSSMLIRYKIIFWEQTLGQRGCFH